MTVTVGSSSVELGGCSWVVFEGDSVIHFGEPVGSHPSSGLAGGVSGDATLLIVISGKFLPNGELLGEPDLGEGNNHCDSWYQTMLK